MIGHDDLELWIRPGFGDGYTIEWLALDETRTRRSHNNAGGDAAPAINRTNSRKIRLMSGASTKPRPTAYGGRFIQCCTTRQKGYGPGIDEENIAAPQ